MSSYSSHSMMAIYYVPLSPPEHAVCMQSVVCLDQGRSAEILPFITGKGWPGRRRGQPRKRAGCLPEGWATLRRSVADRGIPGSPRAFLIALIQRSSTRYNSRQTRKTLRRSNGHDDRGPRGGHSPRGESVVLSGTPPWPLNRRSTKRRRLATAGPCRIRAGTVPRRVESPHPGG